MGDTGTASNASKGGTAQAQGSQAMLLPAEQVERLRSEGVTFELCGEQDAVRVLSTSVYYAQLSCYEPLFERRVGGPRDGQFVNLDFGHLLALRRADARTGAAMLAVALRVEVAVRALLHARMLEGAAPGGPAGGRVPEDGYSIVSDYFASLTRESLGYRTRELERLSPSERAGRLYREHKGRMPLWVYLDCAMFGALCDLALFCARRWGDEGLTELHYMLKDVRDLRNSVSHGLCAEAHKECYRRSSVMRSRPQSGSSTPRAA